MSKVSQYIKEKAKSVNTFYKPSYHLTAPVGWINDPNGFIYFKGEYHLFYQYYPYASEWGPMHWGHAKTKDLVNWEHLPVALEPTEEYEADGCFSGSAIVKGDRLYLMYTGHYERNGIKKETQCIAYSDDGIHFEKYSKNPVISEEHISGIADVTDFRDPKLFKKNDLFYCVVASKTADNRGQILLFESNDLLDWRFTSVLLEGTQDQGIMWECPDLFELDGKDVLIVSPIQMPRIGHEYLNISSSVAFIGTVNWELGEFEVENYHEIDSGMDFYAPQTCENEKKERVMVAWMQMWGRTMPTNDLNHGWAGSMTIPRKIGVVKNKLVQESIEINKKYRKNLLDINNIVLNDTNHLEALISKNSIVNLDIEQSKSKKLVIKIGTNDENIYVSYDFEKEELTLDRSNSGFKIIGDEKPIVDRRVSKCRLVDNKLKLSLYIDSSSIEIFANKETTMTTTFYRKKEDVSLFLESEGVVHVDSLSVEEVTFLEELR